MATSASERSRLQFERLESLRRSYAFFTNCDLSCIAPMPSIRQSMS